MKSILKITIVACSVLFFSSATLANNPTQALGSCMVDKLNGEERKKLSRWIFFAIAAHPEIEVYSKMTEADIQESDEYVGKLITRLLTVDCPNQLGEAYKADPLSLKAAFELVGRVAMQELMADDKVLKSITNYAQYADQKLINSIIGK